MSGSRFPSDKYRLMTILIITSAEHWCIFHPYTRLMTEKSRITKCRSEIYTFLISMKNINACTVCTNIIHTLKSRKQKFIELSVLHAVILNSTCRTLVCNIIRRVCYNKICFFAIHQVFIRFRFCTVTAY